MDTSFIFSMLLMSIFALVIYPEEKKQHAMAGGDLLIMHDNIMVSALSGTCYGQLSLSLLVSKHYRMPYIVSKH